MKDWQSTAVIVGAVALIGYLVWKNLPNIAKEVPKTVTQTVLSVPAGVIEGGGAGANTLLTSPFKAVGSIYGYNVSQETANKLLHTVAFPPSIFGVKTGW